MTGGSAVTDLLEFLYTFFWIFSDRIVYSVRTTIKARTAHHENDVLGTPPVPRPEDENLGVGANMAYGLQHVLTMYGGIVAVP